MGSEISCCKSGRLETVPVEEKILTDGEKTEFLANIVRAKTPRDSESIKTTSNTLGLSPYLIRGVKRVKIFSSNAAEGSVNIIDRLGGAHSVCSTYIGSKCASRCVSPRVEVQGESIE